MHILRLRAALGVRFRLGWGGRVGNSSFFGPPCAPCATHFKIPRSTVTTQIEMGSCIQ